MGDAEFALLLTNGRACNQAYGFWGQKTYGNDFNPRKATALGANYESFWGVIVRSSYLVRKKSKGTNPAFITELGYGGPVSTAKITDGTSKTAVVTEKRLRPANYMPSSTQDEYHDDKGWSDGWDPDTLRMTMCPPAPDDDAYFVAGVRRADPQQGLAVGSVHPGIFNTAFADASVRQLSYEIDQETFNRLGNRGDGEVIDFDKF